MAIAIASASASSEAGLVLCLAPGGHVAVESLGPGPAFGEEQRGASPSLASHTPSGDFSHKLHPHGECLDVSLDPGLALLGQQALNVPAQTLLTKSALGFTRDRDGRPQAARHTAPSSSLPAHTRSTVLRC